MRKVIFLLLLPILFSSCENVYWVNPVTDIGDSQVDKRLLGTWVCSDFSDFAHDYFIIHIGEGSGNWLSYVNQTKLGSRIYDDSGRMYVSKLGNRTFLNMKTNDPDFRLSSWVFVVVEYEMKDNDAMILRDVSYDFMENVVQEQTLPGKELDLDILVLADPSEIQAFILTSEKKKLFQVFLEYKRLHF